MMPEDIVVFNEAQDPEHRELCDLLARQIDEHLPDAESKIWHGHPVWFLEGNPIVGYSRQKPGIRLMFWSGADFGEEALDVMGKEFKDASRFFDSADEVDRVALSRWLKKGREIQWDYANVAKRKDLLERLQ